MDKVLYIIRHKPKDDAMTIRCRSLCQLIKLDTQLVDVVSFNMYNEKDFSEEECVGKLGCDSFFVPDSLINMSKLKCFYEMITGNSLIKFVKKYLNHNCVKSIVVYGGSYCLVHSLYRIAKRYNIKIFVDQTDYFTPHQYIKDRDYWSSVYYFLDNMRIEHLDNKLTGQICISSFFFEKMKEEGGNPFFLPPLIDCSTPLSVAESDIITFFYAGFPGLFERKDIISNLIFALKDFYDTHPRYPFSFCLAGVSCEQVLSYLKVEAFDFEKYRIHIMGKVSHSVMTELMHKSDYGVLFRNKSLYSVAGFSTKFCEYLSAGLPVICNEVGGADEFIIDQKNGFKLPALSDAHLSSLLEHLSVLNNEDYLSMQTEAFKTAVNTFHINSYTNTFTEWFNK